MQFASAFVCEEVLRQHSDNVEETCEAFLKDRKESFFASVRGQVFEAFAHRRLQAARAEPYILVTELFENGTEKKDVQLKLEQKLPSCSFRDAKELQSGFYGIPIARNFPGVDSVVRPNHGFQMSVSNQHGYLAHALTSLQKSLGITQLNAILVCPPDIFPSVKWQNLKTKKKDKAGKHTDSKTKLQSLRQFKYQICWSR